MKALIVIHIFAGILALILGCINWLGFKYGSHKHKRVGRWYFVLMLVNSVIGLFLTIFNRVDYGYLVTFVMIILLMMLSISVFYLKPQHKKSFVYLAFLSTMFCLLYSSNIISASETELPLTTFRVYLITFLVATIAESCLHHYAVHGMYMELSFFIAISATLNNNFYHWISRENNGYLTIAFFMTIFPFHIYKLSNKAKKGQMSF